MPAGLEVAGEPLRFFNDVLSSSDGMIYFTSSSAIADLHEGFIEIAANGSGRSATALPLCWTLPFLQCSVITCFEN